MCWISSNFWRLPEISEHPAHLAKWEQKRPFSANCSFFIQTHTNSSSLFVTYIIPLPFQEKLHPKTYKKSLPRVEAKAPPTGVPGCLCPGGSSLAQTNLRRGNGGRSQEPRRLCSASGAERSRGQGCGEQGARPDNKSLLRALTLTHPSASNSTSRLVSRNP